MARVGIPVPGKDAQCEHCGLLYLLDEQGEPVTQSLDMTCDDCGGPVEPVTEWSS